MPTPAKGTDLLRNPALRDALSKLVKSRLRVQEAITFTVPTPRHTYPVLFGSWAGQTRIVVKLLASFRRFLKIVFRLGYLSRLELPIPRLLGWSWASRHGALKHHVLIQEYVSGRALQREPPGNAQDLRNVASAFAALHSVSRTNLAWAVPALKHGGYLRRGPYIRFHLRQSLARLAALQDRLPPETMARMAESLRQLAQPLWHRSRYELLHGDVKPAHYVVRQDGAYLVDLDEVHFGDFAVDLVPALHLLCEDDPGQKQVFLQRYFEEVEGLRESDFAMGEPFYHADFHLRAAVQLAGLLTLEPAHRDSYSPLFHQHFASCCAALGHGGDGMLA